MPSFAKAFRCKSIGLTPILHPPGVETFAFPYLASIGPSTRMPALIVVIPDSGIELEFHAEF